MAKRRLKKRIRRFLRRLKALLFLCTFVFLIVLFVKVLFSHNYIETIEYSDGYLNVYLNEDDISCILSDSKPNLSDDWVTSNNKFCYLKLNDFNTNLYLKKDTKIYLVKELYYELKENDVVYLSVNQKYNYFKYILGDSNKIKTKIDNDEIASIDENGNITALKNGETKITIDSNFISKIVVTSLLSDRNNYEKKENLSCNKYSEEEEQILDNILKQNINNAGYKTRAGVVEAARFLAIDFPYRINYFYENGRQTTNKVDGEGRYYHEGLYLTEKKFEELTGSTYTSNKSPWGCSIYSYPIKKKDNNGLDCSGFVSWVLLNGGFDVKDVGAGWSDEDDLTDYGDVTKINKDLINSDKIKVGDLLHSEKLGGHIAIIIGIDKEYYYIAQAIWKEEASRLDVDTGVVVTKVEKLKLMNEFPHVVLMQDYYKKDGNLTNMW